MQEDVLHSEDNFKEVFKYYKRKQPPPDLDEVLEVDSLMESRSSIQYSKITEMDEAAADEVGLIPQTNWKVYSLHQHPGLLVIRNPFTCQGQQMWIKRCLKEYPCAGNPNNLFSHGISLTEHTWWEMCQTSEGKKSRLHKKLRWVTLGYHHNWDTKEYSESMRGEMPHMVVKLCSVVARALGFPNFIAEAAIVNYYHLDSTLAPHTDHSEPCVTVPLFSFSFGQSAVFLIGGASKTMRPTALFLHSGDVLVMSGPSRLAYHAVPRVLQATHHPWVGGGKEEEGHQEETRRAMGACGEGWKQEEGMEGDGRRQVERREQMHSWKLRDESYCKENTLENYDIITRPEGEITDVSKENPAFNSSRQAESTKQQKVMKADNMSAVKEKKRDKSHHITDNPEEENYEISRKKCCSERNSRRDDPFSGLSVVPVLNGTETNNEILEYVKCSRINLNVRQVLATSMDQLP
ncbi:hypothetical protein Pcinc_013761 [Petrolisthes cinctipes]|uniref:Fe2OG dioxygenase domain-containing protein n=1 Tax=Petrolisthes cinctipes TaxID=88211 RepID=A0AAE1KRC0_PETCI|nr:hypothetical protein Pcinc_013761 [Petrolisthes cinctipes]